MKALSGRIAVVTGGGSGMGRELVRLLVAEGCHVAMCDVSRPGMAEKWERSPDGLIGRVIEMLPAELPVTFLPVQAVGKSNEHISSPGTLTSTWVDSADSER